jgi:putative transport protein
MIRWLVDQPMVTLFLAVTLGMGLGAVRLNGFSLGASGVLFAGLLLGHWGVTIPQSLTDLGIVLFVYVVGLQAGPKFLPMLRQRGMGFVLLAGVILGTAFLVTLAMEAVAGFGATLSSGLFAGALTSTPGLAAARDAVADPNVAVGFGVAYPFGLLAVVLFIQIVPRALKVDLRDEAMRLEREARPPSPSVVWIEVTNERMHGKTVQELSHAHLAPVAISRVFKQGQSLPAHAETVIGRGDHLRVVGTEWNLRRFESQVGKRQPDFEEPPTDIAAMQLVVSEDSVAGKQLAELHVREQYGVTITRMWRDDFEFVPSGSTRLEIGDTIRIVGTPEDCRRFVELAGQRERRLHETPFLPFLLGLLAGTLLGLAPLPVPGEGSVRLGIAGGPLLIGLLVGHFGRIGPLSFRVPIAARFFVRELGLILFLAGVGTQAGVGLIDVLIEHGLRLVPAAVAVTTLPLLAAWWTARKLLRLDLLSTLGALCGGMTSTPGLGIVSKAADSELPALAYAATYPAALMLVVLLAQLLGALAPVLSFF